MNRKTASLGISLICVLINIIAIALLGIVPSFFVLFALVSSVTTAYSYIRCGYIATTVNMLISLCFSVAFGGLETSFLLLVIMGIVPGIVSGVIQKKRVDYYSSLGSISLVFLLTYILMIGLLGRVIEGGMSGIFDMAGETAKASVKSIIAQNPSLPSEEIFLSIDAVIGYIKMIFPSFAIIFSIIMGFIHLSIIIFVAKKVSGIELVSMPLDMHIAPKSMSYLYFIATVLIIFSSEEGAFIGILNNIVAVLDFILAFCGFSFVESKFKNMVGSRVLRTIIYCFVIVFSGNLAVQILSIIGMVDSFANYRKIKRIGE